jgi:hypothetical protein
MASILESYKRVRTRAIEKEEEMNEMVDNLLVEMR